MIRPVVRVVAMSLTPDGGVLGSTVRSTTRQFLAVAVVLGATLAMLSADTPPGALNQAARSRGSVERFPDETTTGVPAGTVLTQSGSLTITKAGTVVDGLEITGTVVVTADNVTIKNTRIKNTGSIPVRVKGAKNLVIEDTEIDGQGKGIPAVAYNNYTLRRVNIHDVGEGPRIAGSDVTIEDSYLHHMVQVKKNHTDVIQAVGGSNIVIRGNNLQAYNPDTGIKGNAAFMFGEDDKPLRDCLVEGNLMNGGNYTVNGGGTSTTGAQCTFRDNRFGHDFRYGTHANLGPDVTWDSTNTSQ